MLDNILNRVCNEKFSGMNERLFITEVLRDKIVGEHFKSCYEYKGCTDVSRRFIDKVAVP